TRRARGRPAARPPTRRGSPSRRGGAGRAGGAAARRRRSRPRRARVRGSSGRQHPPEQPQRTVLVEELVQVAALRALDARGAAVLAGTAREHPRRVAHPLLEDLEASLGDSNAAWVAVVDENRGLAGLVMEV